MRILCAVLLSGVLATLGLLACVAPVAPAPVATATPEPTLVRPVFPPTPTPMVVIPGDITPITTTNTYPGGGTHRVALKAGDVVELTVRTVGGAGGGEGMGFSLSVDEPTPGLVAMGNVSVPADSVTKYAFVARVDGEYRVLMQSVNPATVVTLSVGIYRKGAPPTN